MIYENESFKIRGAAMEVHRILGCGFHEEVYQEALEREFQLRGIPYEREKVLTINYKGQELKKTYQADFVCYNSIIVELKALSALAPEHTAQVINYLKCTGYKLGLLINFGEISLNIKRLVRFQD